MVLLNITIPAFLARHLKVISNKNRYIVEAIKEKIQRDRTCQWRELLAEAYTQSANEDRVLDRVWLTTLMDRGWK